MEPQNDTPSAVKPLLTYAAIGTPLAVLVFLLFSGFFSAWSGQVVAARAISPDADPSFLSVVILEADGTYHERTWPKTVVKALKLPQSGLGVPPPIIPDDAPTTEKVQFALSFLLNEDGKPPQVVATTSPAALGLGLLAWIIGLMLRNGYVSGSPFTLHPGERRLQQLQTAGQVATVETKTKVRGKKGPPPSKHGRKKGRRR